MFDAYKVGVEFAFSSNHMGFFSAMGAGLSGFNRKLTESERRVNGLKLALIGAGTAMAGIKIGEGLFEMINKGSELVHALAQLQTIGGVGAKQAQSAYSQTLQTASDTHHRREIRHSWSISGVISARL